ncbi:hypothetical protein QJQ45_019277 [Haematococcus lacustris]|nr:hypothetical protein QJQ45_019277 [Haematococcus lacustris]
MPGTGAPSVPSPCPAHPKTAPRPPLAASPLGLPPSHPTPTKQLPGNSLIRLSPRTGVGMQPAQGPGAAPAALAAGAPVSGPDRTQQAGQLVQTVTGFFPALSSKACQPAPPSPSPDGKLAGRKAEPATKGAAAVEVVASLENARSAPLTCGRLQPTDYVIPVRHATLRLRASNPAVRVLCFPVSAAASGSGQQVQGQGQPVKVVIAERRQVIKAALRGLVEAAQPDLSPAEVDAVVAEVNKRMTMGSKQCVLAAVMSLTVLLLSFLGQPTPGFPAAAGPAPGPPPPPDPAHPPYAHPRIPTRISPRTAAAPAQLPPPVQLGIWDPQLLAQIRDAMELIAKASVIEHMMRGPHHHGIRLLPGHIARLQRDRAKAYRYEADQLLRVMANGSAKVVPAPATRDQLVLNMHGSNGHFGVRRTTAMLLHNHWWAGIHADVARILKSCHVCDRARASFNLRAAQLSPLPVQGLFYRWGVDLAGPLPRTRHGNEYLMVCIEHLTKHVELVPIPDKLATTTAYHFHHQVLGRFGASAEVLTDGGREFQGEFADLLQRHLIDHRVTSPHHPQADGLAERAVQTFKDALRKHIAVSGDPAAWDEALPAIALGYRVSPQEATKCSPYSLLYGRAPVLPPAVVQRMARPVNLDDPVVAAHDLLERSAVLSRETAAAMGNIRIAQHRDTLRYATTHSGSYKPAARQLHPGSFVWTQRPQANTLQLGARPEIYRVVSVGANGVARLMGKCGRVMAGRGWVESCTKMPDSTYTVSSGSIGDEDDQCGSDNDFEIPTYNLLPPPLEVATARLAATRLDATAEQQTAQVANEDTEQVLDRFLKDTDIVDLTIRCKAAPATMIKNKSQLNTSYSMLESVLDSGHIARLQRDRAKAYRYEADQLLRVMANGSAKVVPAPATRDQLVLNMHGSNGHFGVRRTTAMLLHNHWWAGIHADVARILKSCHVCDRARASFNLRAAQLSPLPVQGLFYRWGVDLAGPLPRTRHGNEYLMVCIEHLTKHVELVPIPDKLATTTAYHFHHQVLGRFGASAEVLTDGGREFQGEFADLLQRHLIDHRVTSPHHPQADGLAERAVQTFKDALRKHIAVSGDPAAWDEALPAIALGYRVSPQEATKCSPYSLLYGRAPVLPPAVVQRMARPVNLDDPVVAAHDLLERSAVLSRETAAAMGNIRIAQHRDTLRYATTHSGSYKPAARQLHPGSFVWTQRPQANTLQLGARPEIYRVVSVGANGVARLMGKCGRVMAENVCNLAPCHLPDIDPTIDHTLARPTADFPCSICKSPTDADRMLLCDGCGCGYHMFCLTPKLTFVPEGIWLCADCTNRGTTALEVQRRTQAVATQPAATSLHEVFTTKPGRDRAAAAQRLHGRVVRHTGTGLWGVLRFKGQQFHPRFFAVDWVDGTITDAMSPTILRNRQWLQPEGTTLPAAPPHDVQPSRRRSTRLGPSGDNAVLATMATVSTGLISMASLWA